MARNFKKIWPSGGSNPPSSGAEIAQNFNDNADAIKAEFDLKDMQIMNLSIINNKNDYTSATARAAVPTNLRKLGSIISYTTTTGVITEQYIGSDTTQWGADANWTPFADGRKLGQLERELNYSGILSYNKSDSSECDARAYIKSIKVWHKSYFAQNQYKLRMIGYRGNGLYEGKYTPQVTIQVAGGISRDVIFSQFATDTKHTGVRRYFNDTGAFACELVIDWDKYNSQYNKDGSIILECRSYLDSEYLMKADRILKNMLLTDGYNMAIPIYDQFGNISSAKIRWADGVLGDYIANEFNNTHLCFDGYSVSYENIIITQPKVSRDSLGQISNIPTKIIQ